VPVHRQSTSDHAADGAGWSGNETVVDLVKRIDCLAVTVRPDGEWGGPPVRA
jgi:hypothetical protein